MKIKIDVGDTVTILYVDGRSLEVEVLNVPSQTGEYWIFKNLIWDEIIYQNPMSSVLDCVVLNGMKNED
jgi:hypothetical protein